MAEAVLHHLGVSDGPRRRRGLGARQLGPLDPGALHVADQRLVDDDDEAEDDGVAVAPPRCGVDEERLADDVADDPVDHGDGMVGGPELQDPGRGAAWPRELEMVVVQPDDEDLSLARALDIPAGGHACHPRDRTPSSTGVVH